MKYPDRLLGESLFCIHATHGLFPILNKHAVRFKVSIFGCLSMLPRLRILFSVVLGDGFECLLFMSMGWDCVSELQPKGWSVVHPTDGIWVGIATSDLLTGEDRRSRTKSYTSATLFTKNPIWTYLAWTRASAKRGRRLTARKTTKDVKAGSQPSGLELQP
jgi:hypothetical protein